MTRFISMDWVNRARRKTAARLALSPLTARMAKGMIWVTLGGVIARGAAAATSILVARWLGPDGYGELGMVQDTLGVFGIMAGFGLGSTCTRYLADYRERDKEKAGRIITFTLNMALVFGVAMTACCLALAPQVAQNLLTRAGMYSLLAIGAWQIFLGAMSGVASGILSGMEAFRKLAMANLYAGILAPVVILPCLWTGGSRGVLVAQLINSLVLILFLARYCLQECRAHAIPFRLIMHPRNMPWEVFGRYSVPAWLVGMVSLPTFWAVNYILVRTPGGYEELGRFNAANQWRLIIMYLPNLVHMAMVPIFAESYGNESSGDFRQLLNLNFRLCWMITLPLTFVLIAFADLIAAWYGRGYRGVESLLPLLMISYFFMANTASLGSAVSGAGRMWTVLVITLAWSLLLVGFSLWLAPRSGAMGVVQANFISYLVYAAILFGYAKRHFGMVWRKQEWVLAGLTAAVLGCSFFLPPSGAWRYVFGSLLALAASLPLVFLIVQKLFPSQPREAAL